jgi:hypothetical protein
MADQNPVNPGQVTAIPAGNYDVNKDLGRVIDRTGVVDAPSAPHLLLETNAGYTADGISKVNPLYAQYLLTLKQSPNPLQQPYYTNLENAERYLDSDYGGYHPYDINQENWFGENQGWFTQTGNRVGKFAIKAFGSFANALMDIPNAVNAIAEGNIDKMWDNPTNNWATDMMDWSEKNLPNYETNWEREHPFANLIPFYGNAGNGWGKVFENLGFTVGAIGGALVEDLAVAAVTGGVGEIPLAAMQINKAVYNIGKVLGAGKDAMDALRAQIKSADEIVKGLRGIDRFNYAVRQGLWGANMITSGFAEAAFEGIESHKTLANDLKKEFLEDNGRIPTYEEAQQIENTARDAANARFLMNAALLSVTNTIQWGNIIRPFNTVKDVLDQEIKAGVRVGLKEGSRDVFEAVGPSTRLAKFGNTVKNNALVRALTTSSSEGFEEGAQYAIETGVYDYYKRKYDTRGAEDTNNFMKSFGTAMSKTLGSQQGWENIVYGLLGGTLYKGGEYAYYASKGRENPNYKKQIDAVITGLNSQSLTGIFENKYGEAIAATAIEADLVQAARSGNIFQFQNFKHEQFVNFIISGIKQNKFDTRLSQLQELKKLSNEEFQKTFGIQATEENQRAAAEYVDALSKNASYIKEVSDRVNRTFINPFTYKGTGNYKNKKENPTQNKENENYITYEAVKEQLIYNMSVAKNSADRIASLRNAISSADARITPDTIIKLSSDEGLRELKTEYNERAKTLTDSIKLAKDKQTQKELDWVNDRIKDIDDILGEKDVAKQTTNYNKFLRDVISFEINGLDKRKKGMIDILALNEMLKAGKDAFYLQKRSDTAVKAYTALTTKGGFKKLFDEVAALRKEVNEAAVNIQPETPQPDNAQQQATFNEGQVAQGTAPTTQPQDQGLGGTETTTTLTPDQLKRAYEGLQKILKGEIVASEIELAVLSNISEFGTRFMTVDEIMEGDPKANLKNYIQVKSADGNNYYVLKSEVDALGKNFSAATTAAPTATPAPATAQPTGQGAGMSPLRTEDFLDKVFVPQDLRPSFTNAIFSAPADEVNKRLSLTVQPLSAERQVEYDQQRTTSTYTPVTGYPGVFVAKAPIDLQLKHNNVEIGKLPVPERLLFKKGNDYVNIDKLTPQEYANYTGRSAAQYAADLEYFNQFMAFKNYLALEYKNSGNRPITIHSSILQTLINPIITYGELDLVTADNQRPSLTDLKYTSIPLVDANNNRVLTPIIISIPKLYVADMGMRARTEFFNIIYSQTYYDSTVDDTVMRDWVEKNVERLHQLNSRYIAVTVQPDGVLRPIAVRPATAPQSDVNATGLEIIDTAIKAFNTNFVEVPNEQGADGFIFVGDRKVYYKLPNDEAKKINDNFNTNLNNTYYITDNQGQVEFDLSVSPIGAIRLEIFKNAPVESERYRATVYIAPQRLPNLKSFTDIIDALNKEIEKQKKKDTRFAALNISISENNFKKNIPNDTDPSATTETIGPLLSAATSIEVFKNGTMRIKPDFKAITEAYKKAGSRKASTKPAKVVQTPVPLPTTKLTDEQTKEATQFINELLEQGALAEGYTFIAKADPIKFLEFVSQQAQNYTEGWVKHSMSDASAATRQEFGDTLVDFAIELFPAPTPTSTGARVEEKVSKKDGIKTTSFIRFKEDGRQLTIGFQTVSLQEFEQMFDLTEESKQILNDAKELGIQEVRIREIREDSNGKGGVDVMLVVEGNIIDNIYAFTKYNPREYQQTLFDTVQGAFEAEATLFRIRDNQKRVTGKTDDGQFYIIDGKQYRRVTNVIPNDFDGDTTLYENARVAGNVVDGIVKRFFETGDTTISTGIATEAHIAIINSLKEIKRTLKERGEIFVANNVVLFDENQLIAGEADIISVDKNGKFNIYDIKTAKDFSKYDDSFQGKLTKRQNHTNQLSAYANLFENQYGEEVNKLGVLPYEIVYDANGYITKATKLAGIPIRYDETISTVIPLRIQGGPFAGFIQTPTGQDSNPAPISTTLKNQESLQDIEFDNVRDALNSMNIDYVQEGDQVVYIDTTNNREILMPGVTPMQFAKQLGLKVNSPKNTGDFEFRLGQSPQELTRQIEIEQARGIAYAMLPSFIKVEELDKVIDKISLDPTVKEGIFGAFQSGVIYLNRAASIDTVFHETFHAVYRTLLTDEEIDALLPQAQAALAKQLKAQGKTINDLLKEKKALGLYKNLSSKDAYDRLYEEYMADEFMKWKTKKQSASWLDKLFSLIQRFFRWMIRDKNDLEALFRKIDSGQFRYTNIQANRFTNDTTDDFVEPEFVFALIPTRPSTTQIGKATVTINRSLAADRSKQVVQSVAAYYNTYRHLDQFKSLTDDQILDRILNDLREFYSVDNPLYATYTDEQMQEILNSDEAYIYSHDESREVIKDGARKYIDSITYIEQFRYEDQEEQEGEKGSPGTGYDNRSENVGGLSSLPGLLRQYIGFTSYPVTNQFGQPIKLASGVDMITTVDSMHVYYGLLRTLANQSDPIVMFQKMIMFANDNEQTRKFVEKFIKDTGLNVEVLMNENRLEVSTNRALVELIKKGFNKYRIDYIFTEHDIKKQQVKSYHANRKNVENVQFDKWANSFIATYAEYSDDAQRTVRQSLTSVINRYFDPRRTIKYDANLLNQAVSQIQIALNGVGITLSRAYIKYSLLAANAEKYEDLSVKYVMENVKLEFDDPNNKFITKQDFDYVKIMRIANEITLNRDVLDQLSASLSSANNPFFKDIKVSTVTVDEDTNETAEIEEEVDTAMITRLLNVAKGNALFDESVGESSYTNAENKIVYAHQDGTFHVKFAYKLRDAAFRKQLKEQGYREEVTAYKDAYDSEWLTKNALLNSLQFESIADNLLFQRVDGMRAVETNKLGRVITQEFREQKEGVTYGHYSPREFITNMMNAYVSFSKEQKTEKQTVMTAPHLIRVLEASKTADLVNLPILTDVYRDGTITQKAVNQLYEEFLKEFRRIQRVTGEINNVTDNVVENYHTGSFGEDNFTVTKGYRGLKFTDNITSIITGATADLLERKARTDEAITSEDEARVKADIRNAANNMVNASIQVMEREGIVKRDANGHYIRRDATGFISLLHDNFFTGNASLNLASGKPHDNIGHVIINDYLNTLSFNQIMHGDSALSLKNDGGIDAVKRAKGDNASIVSMRTDLLAPELGITEQFTHSSVAIFKEPKSPNPFFREGSKDKKTIDIADAQMYTTVKGLRYTLWGLGRLTPRLARVLDALEEGQNIHAMVDPDTGKTYDGVFDTDNGILKWDEMTNSLKLVYKDSKSYFKMSVVVLQKNLASYQRINPTTRRLEWVARPGWETLHNLRMKMEKDGVHFAAPESASKMMTLDVGQDNKTFTDLKGHLFDNSYFGLQTENPSNKREMTTPTQLLQLIDSEQDDNAIVDWYGETLSIKQIKEYYQEYVSQKDQNSFDIVKQEIYRIEDLNQDVEESIAKGTISPRLSKFYKRAIETLEATGADAQTLEFFSLDENNAPIFNMNMSAIRTKATQLYLSYMSKGVLSQRNPGYTVALFSGMDTRFTKRATRIKDGKVIEWKVVRRESWDANIDGVQDARILPHPDAVTEVGQYFLDELRYNVPVYDENGDIVEGRAYSEMSLPAQFREFLKLAPDQEIPEEIARLFGVRIPTEDKRSMMSFKNVDFLPTNLGSTGMFPKELILLSGADFDIDKEFMARYEFYTTRDDKGRVVFHKYGDSVSVEDRWEEYKKWMSENNKSVKGMIKDLSANDPNYQRLVTKDLGLLNVFDQIFDLDLASVQKKKYLDKFVSEAFKSLNLPSTLEEFIKVSEIKELNNGVINNRLLDTWVALLTNKGMQDIARSSASLSLLEEIQFEDDITLRDKDGNVIGSVFSRGNKYPVDSLVGKYYGYKNNSTGKDNIGIDVVANLTYSLMNKGKIKVERQDDSILTIDGQVFNSFDGNNQYNLATKQFDGPRTFDIMSTLTSAATDEAKEQLNALYNLSQDAIKMVDYMVVQKVPLKTAIYIVNQPVIQQYLQIKNVKQNTLQTPAEERLYRTVFMEEALKRTDAQIREYKEYTDDELYSLFEREGRVRVDC